ncbi:hypothetical protein JHFBIEKO_2962 [Methylobacterium mesophilicum]|nr:hypothetical protein JHFBIEKO_2962 [Methylobacterium mesophilicum]
MWLVCVPLYRYGVPLQVLGNTAQPLQDAAPIEPASGRGLLGLIAGATALIAFVGFGLSNIPVEWLVAEGLSRSEAIGYGAALGVIQIGARAVDFLGGGRWDGLSTGLIAALAVLAALSLLAAADGGPTAAGAFVHPALRPRERCARGGAGDHPARVLRAGELRPGCVANRIAAQPSFGPVAADLRGGTDPVRWIRGSSAGCRMHGCGHARAAGSQAQTTTPRGGRHSLKSSPRYSRRASGFATISSGVPSVRMRPEWAM